MGRIERRRFAPAKGHVFHNRGGGDFLCTSETFWIGYESRAWMQNVKSGWSFEARDIRIYDNGDIDWGYSVGGRWADLPAFMPGKEALS